jgi:hypothetical protein
MKAKVILVYGEIKLDWSNKEHIPNVGDNIHFDGHRDRLTVKKKTFEIAKGKLIGIKIEC